MTGELRSPPSTLLALFVAPQRSTCPRTRTPPRWCRAGCSSSPQATPPAGHRHELASERSGPRWQTREGGIATIQLAAARVENRRPLHPTPRVRWAQDSEQKRSGRIARLDTSAELQDAGSAGFLGPPPRAIRSPHRDVFSSNEAPLMPARCAEEDGARRRDGHEIPPRRAPPSSIFRRRKGPHTDAERR